MRAETDFLSMTDGEREYQDLLRVKKGADKLYAAIIEAKKRGLLSKKAMLFLNDAGAEYFNAMLVYNEIWNGWDMSSARECLGLSDREQSQVDEEYAKGEARLKQWLADGNS